MKFYTRNYDVYEMQNNVLINLVQKNLFFFLRKSLSLFPLSLDIQFFSESAFFCSAHIYELNIFTNAIQCGYEV